MSSSIDPLVVNEAHHNSIVCRHTLNRRNDLTLGDGACQVNFVILEFRIRSLRCFYHAIVALNHHEFVEVELSNLLCHLGIHSLVN